MAKNQIRIKKKKKNKKLKKLRFLLNKKALKSMLKASFCEGALL